MANLVEINSNNLAQFLENFVDSGVKLVDELNLFEDDELFAAVPYGKLIGYFTKKIIQINNPVEALKKAIALSLSYNLLVGIGKNKIAIVINEDEFNSKIHKIKEELKHYDTQLSEFSIDEFYENEIVVIYTEKINEVFENYLSNIEFNKLNTHRKDYFKIDFIKLLEKYPLIYEKLTVIFQRKSYEEYLKLNRRLAYHKELKNLFNENVLNDQAGMTLADIYIEPNYKVHEYCLVQNFRTDRKSHGSNVFHKTSDNSIHQFLYEIISSSSSQLSLANSNTNLFFILGYPGQGKSSLYKKIMFDIYSDNVNINKEIVFIKIRNITDTISLINNPLDTLYEHWLIEYNINEKEFSKKSFQESLLILDGLDELFMKENLHDKVIDEFCKIFVRETEYKTNLTVIITSRYGYINIDLLKKTHALVIQLDEFNEDQQLQWLTKYKVFHPKTNLSVDKIHEYNNDDSYKSIKELINQPILLHLIATLNQEVTIETNKAKIYDRLFTELINRSWAKEGQIDNLMGLEKEDLREFLQDVAYAIFRSGREYIHKSELTNLPETGSFISKLNSKDKMRNVLKNIMIAFYFQETKKDVTDNVEAEKNDYAIEFLHKSLQEYLVAEKLWEEIQVFIDKDIRKRKYIVDSARAGLHIINKLYADETIPNEVLKDFNEIVKNSEPSLRVQLYDRFKEFLPNWLRSGLVLEYDWSQEHFIEKESNLIWNLFSLLAILTDETLLFEDDETNFFSHKRSELILKSFVAVGNLKGFSALDENQEVRFGVDIYNASFFILDFIFDNTIESNYKFDSIVITRSDFAQVKSSGSISFVNSKILNTTFSMHFRNDIVKYYFEKCVLYSCTFYVSMSTFKNCVFEQCIFYAGNILDFQDCTIKNCSFFIYDNKDKEYVEGLGLINCSVIQIPKDENLEHKFL